ncbi:30S ribosomal subunit protein S6 [Candidatus Hodgkinia cicadicola]|nr:30S ribosomal subunit protein S6 [Candidatus Hodgkinia cicadicola]
MPFGPNAAETEAEAISVSLESSLTEFGAQAIKRARWGKTSSAYKIRGFNNWVGCSFVFARSLGFPRTRNQALVYTHAVVA